MDLAAAEALLAIPDPPRGGTRTKKDNTEPRVSEVWFKLIQRVSEPCDNPECIDPRPPSNKGRNVTAMIKGKNCCRYCFLAGWLSDVVEDEDAN